MPAQVHPAHAARLIQVGKAAFDLLAPLPQEPLSALAPNPPPVGVHGGLLFRLPLPTPPPALGLRAVTPHLPLHQLHQHFATVIPLVQHHFLRPFRIHSSLLASPATVATCSPASHKVSCTVCVSP